MMAPGAPPGGAIRAALAALPPRMRAAVVLRHWLTFRSADGRRVVVQAPTSLGWDGARLAEFAAGVQVLGNAQPGRG
jgi:hypothetical protein